ncbi:MAG: UPF0149 family protein [Methylococcaceae bacterium]|nr:UPF0149 family protein [Methylococcaceae bacterium]
MTYPDIQALLERHDADLGAAEAQGIATGMLCLDERIDANLWLKELFQHSPELSEVEQQLLTGLFKKTHALLGSSTFEFDLFLPDDTAILSQQAEALSNWCRGFLFGIGYGSAKATWPGDSGEILKDLIEFTKLDTQTEGEEDARALMEIHEYCRAAIMLLRDDLRGNNSQCH